MPCGWRMFVPLWLAVCLGMLLCACGGNTPWRYDPGAPARPAGLAATADNGRVLLSWPNADNAAAYVVYYATTPGVVMSADNRAATVVGNSYIKTGLTNGTTYYFVVASVNSNSQSAASNEVSATPALLGSYVQSDLEGTWNFNVLVSGTGAGWMRGALTVDGAGSVQFGSFLDSAGNAVAPAGFLPLLFLDSGGHVRDTIAGTPVFDGVMAANRNMIVGHSPAGGVSRMLVILQKQVPGVTFSNAGDLQGFGNTGGGGRRFIYNQLSSGSSQEWEFAVGQMGRDQKAQYTVFSAPSNPARPGDKASMFNISADGIVTESLTGATPQPAVVIDRGVMSADKSVIVGTATDTSGASPRYVLRIYQLINIVANDPNTFAVADLAGTYDLLKLQGGAHILSASGQLTVSDTGTAAFSAYTDSTGATALPADFNLAIDASGVLSAPADTSLSGKFSYFKDMFVVTGTASTGDYSLSIALKR